MPLPTRFRAIAWCGGLLQRVADEIRADVGRFSAQVQAIGASDDCAPGLYTYRVNGSGGTARLHLRIQQDYTALLFVNASDVIHLTPTAAQMAKLALDEVPEQQALARLQLSYPSTAPSQLGVELRRIGEMIDALKQPGPGCPTCELNLETMPLFSARAQAPYKVDLALHYICNNNCAHCYNEPGRRDMPSLSTPEWRAVLQKLYNLGVPYIIFTGGEPTLHPSLFELIRFADNLGQITGLNSNGRRLAQPGFAVRLKEAGLDHVQITLVSHRAELHNEIVRADAFDETVNGIKSALDAGLHTITNTTLVQANVAEALETVDFLYELGIRTFAMNGMIHSGCGVHYPGTLTETELEPVLIEVKQLADDYGMRFFWYTPTRYCRMSPLELGLGPKSCNAGEYSICIEPNGDVLPCQSYYVPVGNILSDSWENIWDSDLLRSLRYRRETPQAANLPEECWHCDQLSICGGGCPLERKATHMEVSGT